MNRKVWALFLALVILALSGCQAGEDRSVSVTSVAEICGLGPVGWVDSFSGVVSARSEVEIRKDPQKTVAEIHVKQGDAVTEGDVLFTYEQGQAELQLQRAKLELQQLQYTLQAHKEKKLELEKLKAKAKEDQQLSYTVENHLRQGIEVVTCYNDEYPQRVKRRMEDAAPPVFYRCGNSELLSRPMLAIVGISGVKTSPEVRDSIETLVRNGIRLGYTILTGGELGVSRVAMNMA